MGYRPLYRLLVCLLLVLFALAIAGVIWYYQEKLDGINQEIRVLNEAYE